MSALAPGDQAFITRGFCSTHESTMLGRIVTVKALLADHSTYCSICLKPSEILRMAQVSLPSGREGAYPIPWLRKIEPLSDLERDQDQITDPIHRIVPAPA